jgi:hypothetical protein
LKIKLKCRHFDTIEVIEAESQAVLNTLTEHDFQNAFKNDRSAGNGTYAQKGLLGGRWWPVGPKLVLTRWQHLSRNYGWLFVFVSVVLKVQLLVL